MSTIDDDPRLDPDGILPIEVRISHRILLYAEQCWPNRMNQFTIEDIVREEIAAESDNPI